MKASEEFSFFLTDSLFNVMDFYSKKRYVTEKTNFVPPKLVSWTDSEVEEEITVFKTKVDSFLKIAKEIKAEFIDLQVEAKNDYSAKNISKVAYTYFIEVNTKIVSLNDVLRSEYSDKEQLSGWAFHSLNDAVNLLLFIAYDVSDKLVDYLREYHSIELVKPKVSNKISRGLQNLSTSKTKPDPAPTKPKKAKKLNDKQSRAFRLIYDEMKKGVSKSSAIESLSYGKLEYTSGGLWEIHRKLKSGFYKTDEFTLFVIGSD